MRKNKIFIILLVGMVLGGALAAGVYFVTAGEVAWQKYFDEKLVPNAVLAMTTVFGIYLTAKPIITRIKSTLDGFNQATKDVNGTAESGRLASLALENQEERLAKIDQHFSEIEKGLDAKLKELGQIFDESIKKSEEVFKSEVSKIKTTAENTERIARIGFGNTEELVKKGYAREIARVGAENEEK